MEDLETSYSSNNENDEKVMRPEVSICIPAFNCEDYLREAVQSVQRQEIDNIEIVIVDDGSTDQTCYVANQLALADHRIRVYSQKNSGSCVARNLAFKMAKGRYICLLDSDDIWPGGKLKTQLKILESHPNAIVIGAVRRFTDEKSRKYGSLTIPFKYDSRGEYLRRLLTIPDTQKLLINTLCCRAEYIKNDPWDPRFKTGHDWEVWIRLAYKYEFIHLDEVFQYYRKHPASTTKNNRLRLIADCQLDVVNVHGPKILSGTHELNQLRANLVLSFVNHAVYAKSRTDALYLLWKAAKYKAWLNSRSFYRLLVLSLIIPFRPTFL